MAAKSRILALLKSDEDVGRIGKSTPAAIAAAHDAFLADVLATLASDHADRRILTPSELRTTIDRHERFDFLRDLVAHIPSSSAAQPPTSIHSSLIRHARASAPTVSAPAHSRYSVFPVLLF